MHGKHVIGTVKVQDKELLASEKRIKEIITSFCKRAKLSVVSETLYLFSNPAAITYCLILSQSHLIVHTWPEYDTITFDLFTCSPDYESEAVGKLFADETRGSLIDEKIILV